VNQPLPPTDTLREPHEPLVDTPGTAGIWAVALAGPVLAMSHFWFVYLAAEATCEAERAAGMWFLDPDSLTWLILVATGVGVLAALAAAWIGWRSIGTRMLATVGTLMSVGSAATILAVGLPALVLAPC
jgi:hypothetical protein